MRAKQTEKTLAMELRKQGLSVPDIALKVGVAKSSVSSWVRDVPVPQHLTQEFRTTRKKERQAAEALELAEKREARKSQRILSGDGRWMLHAPHGYEGKTYIEGRYIYEHRFLMEQAIGRLLTPGEVVHHINEDKLDNRLENLELTTTLKHARHHGMLRSKRKNMVELECPVCLKNFVREKRQTFLSKGGRMTTCSRGCGVKAGHMSKKGVVLESKVLRMFVGA